MAAMGGQCRHPTGHNQSRPAIGIGAAFVRTAPVYHDGGAVQAGMKEFLVSLYLQSIGHVTEMVSNHAVLRNNGKAFYSGSRHIRNQGISIRNQNAVSLNVIS